LNPLTGISGAFLTRTRVEGVNNHNGQPTLSPNGAGVVQTDYKYDWFGRIVEEKNPTGDIIGYSYDRLGRVRFEIYGDPNNSSSPRKEYRYVTNAATNTNSIEEVNENGNRTLYRYTPFGQLQYVDKFRTRFLIFDIYDTLLTNYYDSKGRLFREDSFEGRVFTDYDLFDRPVEIRRAHHDNSDDVFYRETYIYNNAFNMDLSSEQKTVIGDSNAPSVVTVTYRDLLGRVVRQGYRQGTVEHLDEFTYDNRDNQLTLLSAWGKTRGHTLQRATMRLEYDWVGRVVTETPHSPSLGKY
jgi:hypothetical protein